jgi:ComF family protein
VSQPTGLRSKPRPSNAWLRRAVDLFYPRNCQCCAEPLSEDERGVICAHCLKSARTLEPPFCKQCALPYAGALDEPFVCGYCHELKFHFQRAAAGCRAEGIVRDSIHRFKYNREMYYETHLLDWLLAAATRWIEWREVDAIVPVPLHPRKQREREFNQAEVLAVALGRAFGKRVARDELRRIKDTPTQTALDARARAANLRNAFAVREPAAFAGQRLVLVDDVFTTGATLDACAKMLRGAGATHIIALAVARGV